MNDKSYNEIARSMTAEAKQACIGILSKEYEAFQEAMRNGKDSVIEAVNLARSMGNTIQEITNHQKLTVGEFNQLQLVLPNTGIDFAKECLAIQRACEDKPITTYEQAKPLFDKLAVQMEIFPRPARGSEKKRGSNDMEEFLARVIRVKNESGRLIKEKPIAEWPPFYRRTFVNEAKYIHDLYEEALELAKVEDPNTPNTI